MRLEGLTPKDTPQNSIVCTLTPEDNCCSNIDELKIFKSWTSFSLPKLTKFGNDMLEMHNSVVKLIKPFQKLDTGSIKYHYTKYDWVKEKKTSCVSAKFALQSVDFDKTTPFNVIQ